MTFLSLLREEPRSIAFGFLYTFGSSPGQTFFVSIFVPSIMASLALGVAEFSLLYATATVAAALVLPFLGRLIDKIDLLFFGVATGMMLTLASVGIALADGLPLLLASLFGLRLFGQGLMSHTAVTAASRYFEEDRGKALALTSLGHAAGQALLPLAAIFLIGLLGWRTSFFVSGLLLGLLTAVTAGYQVRKHREFRFPVTALADVGKSLPPVRIWRIPYFWSLAPVMLAAPLIVTALIFHQGWIAERTGIGLEWFAAAFMAFALAQVPGSVIAGPLVDRFSARRLLPLHLLPGMVGILLFMAIGSHWAVLVYLALLGMSNGFASTLRNAAIAEISGSEHVGSARSFVGAMMVLSTAAGPALFGVLISIGMSVDTVLWTALTALALASVTGWTANRRWRPGRMDVPLVMVEHQPQRASTDVERPGNGR